jgi:hypothetical protein
VQDGGSFDRALATRREGWGLGHQVTAGLPWLLAPV